MRTRTGVGILAAALMLALPAVSQAHPCLVGAYSAPVPGCGPTVYEFGPGEYQGCGVWKGPMMVTVGGLPIGPGVYVLRMASETQGTIGIRDGKMISTQSGYIDLAA